MYGYIIFSVSMALAVVCISYSSMARQNGWPVGEILSKDTSVSKIAAFVTALWVVVKAFMVFQWWSPLVILVIGWLVGFILTMALKQNVQFLGLLGIFPAFLFTILYLSESKPFGMLHTIFS